MKRTVSLALVVFSLLLAACGDDDGVTPPADAGVADTGVRPLPECTLPAPIVAGTPETDAVANAPARCGASEYTWLRDASLGELVARSRLIAYRTEQLTTLAAASGVMLPRPPEHGVYLERVAYKTQDRGRMVESSMALAYPNDDATATARPVLLLLHGTSGATAGCGSSTNATMQLLAGIFASYGWIVAAPDFLGLESFGAPYGALHPYMIGEPTAIASLDAARAAVRAVASHPGNLCASTQLMVYGSSQGGHAALWVDRLAPYYAREFELAGVVADVPPADSMAETERALTTPIESTSNIIAVFGAIPQWYGIDDRLGDVLRSPFDVDVPAALAAACDPGSVVGVPANLSDVFTDPILAAVAAGDLGTFDPWGCIMTENSLTTTSIPRITPDSASYGISYILGENDELVNPPIERAAYDTLCTTGMPLEYLECAGAGHFEGFFWSVPEALDFLTARAAREPFTAECTRPAAVRCRGTI